MGKSKLKGSFQRREDKLVVTGVRSAKRQHKKAQKRAARDGSRTKPRMETFQGHDKGDRKLELKRKLEVSRLQRAVAKQEALLRDYHPPQPPTPEPPESRRRRRQQDFYDLDTSKWELKGAARPAPIIGEEPHNPHAPGPAGQNLFALQGAAFTSHPACAEYLQLLCELGCARLAAGHSRDAIPHFERCLELDPTDAASARRGLVRALLDRGSADRARAVIDSYKETDTGAVLAWSLAAIEYISWRLLGEEGSSEGVAAAAVARAHAANPFVAWSLAHPDAFEDAVELVEDIRETVDGTVEEALQYWHWQAPLWQGLDGASDWLARWLAANAQQPPEPRGGGGEDGDMYLRMFETAVAMAVEEAEAAAAEAEEGEDGGGGMESEGGESSDGGGGSGDGSGGSSGDDGGGGGGGGSGGSGFDAGSGSGEEGSGSDEEQARFAVARDLAPN